MKSHTLNPPSQDDLNYIFEWLDIKVVNGKVSTIMKWQLALCMKNLEIFRIDIFNVADEIGSLENAPYSTPSNTKKSTMFRHSPLKGLFHKHFTQADYIIKNINNYWGGKNFEKFQQYVRDEILGDNEEVEMTPEIIAKMSNDFVIGAYQNRSKNKKMTGEWIIYAKQDNINYYLTLARHSADPNEILDRARACQAEFPNLNLP